FYSINQLTPSRSLTRSLLPSHPPPSLFLNWVCRQLLSGKNPVLAKHYVTQLGHLSRLTPPPGRDSERESSPETDTEL
ncbi:Fatty acid oxidation complex subunit alpha, partial [Dissostichus eleginoides]